MSNLVGTFSDIFTFARPVAAAVRTSAGELANAAPNVARFDFDEDGNSLGLLVTPGDSLGQADRCSVIAGNWEVEGAATVLHEYAAADGTIVRRAFYTRTVKATLDAALRVEGHHRLIGAVAGFLRNRDGAVQYRERVWLVDAKLGTGVAGEQLGDGSGALDGEDRGLVGG